MSGGNLSPETQEQVTAEAAASESQGAVAACACTLLAVVNADGTLARGLGATSSTRIDPQIPGQYEVKFDRDVSNCTYTATIGLSGNMSSPTPGEITVAGRDNDPQGVFIATYDIQGVGVDLGFHLAVHCPPT
jgi:hypothetical protein